MKLKDDILIVEFLLEQIEKIEEYLSGKSEEDFYRDDILKDACYARLLVLGEYAGKTSEGFRKRHNTIEWDVIKGARNFYAHAYGALDWTKIWETLNNEVPALKQKLKTIIENQT